MYDENKLGQEREKLKNASKVDEMTLIEYIKLSIEILMNMKYEDFEKEANMINKKAKKNEELESVAAMSDNSNRFMT